MKASSSSSSSSSWKMAALLSAVVVPALILIAQWVTGSVRFIEVLLGCFVGTGFFLVTNLMVHLFEKSAGLKIAIAYSYILKISLLLSAGVGFSLLDLNSEAFAMSIAISGIIFVIANMIFYERSARRTES